MKKRPVALLIGVIALGALYANNTSLMTPPIGKRPLLLAHRGVHQDYSHAGVDDNACTATRIYPPHNDFIEDTLPAIGEAFKEGADVVDFDVHPTADGSWAVFHDWTLECRTNGQGVTREKTLAYLKSLDVGYGYTADGGKTYPLRGKGVGLIPSLTDVLNQFPGKSFIIHIKSNDPWEGKALAGALQKLPSGELAHIAITGGDRPIGALHAASPSVRTMSPKSIKSCITRYAALGWSSYVPQSCRNSVLIVPMNVTPWMWGWSNKFLRRMDSVGSLVFVVDDYKAGGTKGLNNETDLGKLPKGYAGGIWTDEVDVVGAKIRARS